MNFFKTILPVIFLLILHQASHGQSDTTYFSAYDVKLKKESKEYAAYYELNNGMNREGKVERFYPTHESYGFAFYAENRPEGHIKQLFKNGELYQEGNYENRSRSGIWTLGFENGQSFASVKYDQEKSLNHAVVINIMDSLGTLLVSNGSGKYRGPNPLNREIIIEGEFRSGLKIGEWTSKKEGRTLDIEHYTALGELISGTSWAKDGKEYHYTVIEEQAEHKGGMEGWIKHLKKTFRYPAKAIRNDIEGDVDVTFIVNKNGDLENIEVLNGIGYGCDEEAIRVVSKSKWNPGKQKGQPVKSRMRFRVSFRLR